MDYRDTLPADLEDIIGTITIAEKQSPGVYYLNAHQEGQRIQEYYAVLSSSPLFPKVQQHGKKVGSLLLFPMDDNTSGWRIIDYEICKYMMKSQTAPFPENILHDLALHAAEYHPEYFGEYPAPLITPRGYTLRHQKLANGIYWLETSRCEEMLALCYPVWNAELSEMAKGIGMSTEYDKTHGLDETMGYLFFSAQSCCIPILELMETRKEWEGALIDKPALMNAIWAYSPQYALIKNGQEQTGKCSLLSLFIREDFSTKTEQQPSLSHMISLFPDVGTDFLHLP